MSPNIVLQFNLDNRINTLVKSSRPTGQRIKIKALLIFEISAKGSSHHRYKGINRHDFKYLKFNFFHFLYRQSVTLNQYRGDTSKQSSEHSSRRSTVQPATFR